MKIFYSMPMAGLSDDEIHRARTSFLEMAKATFKEEPELIDSVVKNHEEKSALECLSESIGLMAQASAVFFAKGWEEARGCKIEYEVAKAYGLPIYQLA
jgi:hypothetical protein